MPGIAAPAQRSSLESKRPQAKKSPLMQAATMAGLASALGGMTVVFLPAVPALAVAAAAVGAVGGFFIERIGNR